VALDDGLLASLFALDGAVYGRALDAEEVAELGGAVLAGTVQGDEVRFLAGVELGLLAAQVALGFGDAHSFAGA
jgi:hypothetical protein